jgi:hypothetical protein
MEGLMMAVWFIYCSDNDTIISDWQEEQSVKNNKVYGKKRSWTNLR